jgi:hypothetical protein
MAVSKCWQGSLSLMSVCFVVAQTGDVHGRDELSALTKLWGKILVHFTACHAESFAQQNSVVRWNSS